MSSSLPSFLNTTAQMSSRWWPGRSVATVAPASSRVPLLDSDLHAHPQPLGSIPCCCCCWLLSHVQLCWPPWTLQHTGLPCPFTVPRSSLKLTSIKLVMSSNPHPLRPSPLRLNPFSMPSITFLLIFLHRKSQVTERVVANVLISPSWYDDFGTTEKCL